MMGLVAVAFLIAALGGVIGAIVAMLLLPWVFALTILKHEEPKP
jgi:hypothetical protein